MNQTITETIFRLTYSVLAYFLIRVPSFFVWSPCTPRYDLTRQGLHCAPYVGNKSEHFYSTIRRPEYCIICIGSESCLWSIVGLPGSCGYYLTFRSFGYGSKGRTTAIVFLIHQDKHLSRESRKLTVMMRRELVSYSMTKYKSITIFSALREGPVFTRSGVYNTQAWITE